MNRSIVWHLILKDLYLYRWLMAASLVVGVGGLLIQGEEGAAANIRLILMMTSIIALGIFIAMYGVLAERQTKSLLFVLSLPISPMQYTAAKVTAALIAFLGPWLAITALIVAATLTRDPPPDGSLPFAIALMVFMLANFCALLALLLITRSELWAVAGILLTNFGVASYMNVVPRIPGIAEHSSGPVAVWNSEILTVIGVEAAVAVLCLVVALYVQSRRRDFI